MVQWATFAGITGVVLVLLLVLSHLTQTALSDGSDSSTERRNRSPSPSSLEGTPSSDEQFDSSTETNPERDSERPDSSAGADTDAATARDSESITAGTTDANRPLERASETTGSLESERAHRNQSRGIDPESLSTGELLANVALSQGLFAFVLLGAVLYTGIPADALGVEFSWTYLQYGLVVGTAFGLVLYVANEISAAAATRLGFDHDEELRSMLAPDSMQGWLVLLVVVLPIIALFEELLFRAALIGVISAGFGVSPWLLAVVSSVAFAIGHGMQGSVGIVVTGALGFVLAAAFIVTGSFLVVVVAHYLVNALEFVVHEGLDFEWARTLES